MLKQQIRADSNNALKQKNQEVLSALRMLLAAVLAKEKDKRYKLKSEKDVELADEEIIDVIIFEIKKRKDAIVLYEQGKRPELAEKEQKEIEILKKYLPEQLSEEETKKLVLESISKTEAKEIKDMGRVMADLNPKIKGRADSSEVSKTVKELINKLSG